MENILKIKPRKYQEKIAETCLKKNCLVVLPTGLGKTLIALMVSIEMLKKFPQKKVLFLAPTRPLAEQHINYFNEKLPELWAEKNLFTGTIKKEKRKELWKNSNIIFSTPQCVANDVKNKLYSLKDVSLLIEDEAHRCVKNYDYNYVAKKYDEQAKEKRIIGLTASPGSDSRKIKEIAKNLLIEEIEIRTRDSEDVKEYLQELEFEKKTVELPKEFFEIKVILKELYDSYIDELRKRNFLFGPDNKIALIQLQNKISAQISRNIQSRESYLAMSYCAQAIKLSHAIELLETQTLESFFKYLEQLRNQAEKKQSKGVVRLVASKEFNLVFSQTRFLLEKGIEHPKIEEIIRTVRDELKLNSNFSAIIFTQFRETASIISRNLNKLKNINSKVFVGQTKKGETGLSQKDQKEIIEKFKEKEINILVATSIGEEGLDIPEVSAVIFYEPVSSAIRSIQRRGRTARLSKGKLIILITKKTKDEFSYYASRSREKKMKTEIEKVKDNLKKGSKKEEKQKKLF